MPRIPDNVFDTQRALAKALGFDLDHHVVEKITLTLEANSFPTIHASVYVSDEIVERVKRLQLVEVGAIA